MPKPVLRSAKWWPARPARPGRDRTVPVVAGTLFSQRPFWLPSPLLAECRPPGHNRTSTGDTRPMPSTTVDPSLSATLDRATAPWDRNIRPGRERHRCRRRPTPKTEASACSFPLPNVILDADGSLIVNRNDIRERYGIDFIGHESNVPIQKHGVHSTSMKTARC